MCEACNYAKEAPGWGATVMSAGPSAAQPGAPPHRVQITTPTGHSYDATAPPLLPGRARAALRPTQGLGAADQTGSGASRAPSSGTSSDC
jgi:hypothetical protein